MLTSHRSAWSRRRHAAAALFVGAALAGCATTNPAPSGAGSTADSSTATPTEKRVAATRVTTFAGGGAPAETVLILKHSTHEIACEFYVAGDNSGTGGCGSTPMLQAGDPMDDFDEWWVGLTRESATPSSRSDAPWAFSSDPPAQQIAPGETAVAGDYACTAAEDQLTCWNTASGAGATISTKAISAFTSDVSSLPSL